MLSCVFRLEKKKGWKKTGKEGGKKINLGGEAGRQKKRWGDTKRTPSPLGATNLVVSLIDRAQRFALVF